MKIQIQLHFQKWPNCINTITGTPSNGPLIAFSNTYSDFNGSMWDVNYSGLLTQLDTYHTTSAFNTAIGNYYNKTNIDSKLAPYLNTLNNTTIDANYYISLSKSNKSFFPFFLCACVCELTDSF